MGDIALCTVAHIAEYRPARLDLSDPFLADGDRVCRRASTTEDRYRDALLAAALSAFSAPSDSLGHDPLFLRSVGDLGCMSLPGHQPDKLYPLQGSNRPCQLERWPAW